jgi:hypothetical protein
MISNMLEEEEEEESQCDAVEQNITSAAYDVPRNLQIYSRV